MQVRHGIFSGIPFVHLFLHRGHKEDKVTWDRMSTPGHPQIEGKAIREQWQDHTPALASWGRAIPVSGTDRSWLEGTAVDHAGHRGLHRGNKGCSEAWGWADTEFVLLRQLHYKMPPKSQKCDQWWNKATVVNQCQQHSAQTNLTIKRV